jgi:cytochrome c biogenesis protein CcdA
MGLVNIKELFFFKKGFSLMITDGAKNELAGKIRGIINAHDTAAMLGATVLLAVFVNLIELGCTIGLPAVFTRVLSVRDAGLAEKYWYMAVYNAAYVIPLLLIVSLFILTMGRYRMTESHGKLLKGISGVLMLLLGLLMLFRPEALLLN